MDPITQKAAAIAASVKTTEIATQQMSLEDAVAHVSAEVVTAAGERGVARMTRLAVAKAGREAIVKSLDAGFDVVDMPIVKAGPPVKSFGDAGVAGGGSSAAPSPLGAPLTPMDVTPAGPKVDLEVVRAASSKADDDDEGDAPRDAPNPNGYIPKEDVNATRRRTVVVPPGFQGVSPARPRRK